MSYVHRTVEAGVATLTIVRPPINALDRDSLDELDEAIGEVEEDTKTRAVIVASGLEGVFCAGGDLRYWRQFPRQRAREVSRTGRQVFARLRRLPVPTIAAIEGHVIGDGLALALSADLRVVADAATFRLPEVDYGFIPGWGVPHLLEQAVGRLRALELLLTGLAVGAERAYLLGLATQIVPAGHAAAAANRLAESLSRKSPHALVWAKRVLMQTPEAVDRGAWEEECFAQVWGGEDWQMGLEAMLANRPAVFSNRVRGEPR